METLAWHFLHTVPWVEWSRWLLIGVLIGSAIFDTWYAHILRPSGRIVAVASTLGSAIALFFAGIVLTSENFGWWHPPGWWWIPTIIFYIAAVKTERWIGARNVIIPFTVGRESAAEMRIGDDQ